jgi:hypothetical protein
MNKEPKGVPTAASPDDVKLNVVDTPYATTCQKNCVYCKISCYFLCCKCLCLKKRPPEKEEMEEKTVLMLGVDGSGKTTILERLSIRPEEKLTKELAMESLPTTGINIQQVIHKNIKFEFWEVIICTYLVTHGNQTLILYISKVGGSANLRKYWPR